MLIVDLRKNGTLDEYLKDQFQDVIHCCVDPFHQYIEDISKGVESNLDWWISAPVSRDVLYSNLFHSFSVLFFLQNLINDKVNMDKIVVDDVYLKDIILELLSLNNNETEVSVEDEGKYQTSILRNLYEITRFHILFTFKFIICKFFLRRKNNLYKGSHPITLIDTFYSKTFKEKERFYNGLLENLTGKEKKNIFFVPTILDENFTDLYRSIKFLRNHSEKYLLKEDFLMFSDLIFTLGYFFRKNKISFNKCQVLGCNFYKLVEAELFYLNRYLMCIESLLSYQFAKNLNIKGIKIKMTINWFENQPLDKGWNLGFNSFHKDSLNLGYRGLVPANFFLSQKYVTDLEFKENVTPKIIYTVGDNEGLETNRFSKNIQIKSGPAFRFKHLWDSPPKEEASETYIFIALPITLDQSIAIMTAINFINNADLKKSSKFLIKLHPTMEKELLVNNLNFSISNNMSFTEEDATIILLKSNLIISGMSSICLEACAAGVPLIIFNSQNLIPFNSLPNNISKKIWRTVFNKEELKEQLNYFLNMESSERKLINSHARKVKEDNFVPVNRETVLDFLNF